MKTDYASRMKRFTSALFLIFLVGCSTIATPKRFTGPWGVKQLHAVPEATFGPRSNLVSEVYYAGELFQGKPTRIFAYYARPAEGNGPFPAMLLVHGGGGKAFREWAEHWAQRGYVALAMDLAGHGPVNLDRGVTVLQPTRKTKNKADANLFIRFKWSVFIYRFDFNARRRTGSKLSAIRTNPRSVGCVPSTVASPSVPSIFAAGT